MPFLDILSIVLFTLACVFSYRRDGWAREETLRMESGDHTPWDFWSKSWLRTKMYGKNHWRVKYALYDGWHLLGWLMYPSFLFAALLPCEDGVSVIVRAGGMLAGWALATLLYRISFNPKP